MIDKMKKHKKLITIISDLLLIPAGFICEKLTDLMLTTNEPCQWVRMGGKCAACGGTHFVNSLLNGHIVEAFNHNQYLFLLVIYFAVTVVLLNLVFLFDKKLPLKILKHMYNIPAVLILSGLLFLFIFLRNIPLWIKISEIILSVI